MKFTEDLCHSWCAKCINDSCEPLVFGEVYELFDVNGVYVDVYGKMDDGLTGILCGVHEDNFELV